MKLPSALGAADSGPMVSVVCNQHMEPGPIVPSTPEQAPVPDLPIEAFPLPETIAPPVLEPMAAPIVPAEALPPEGDVVVFPSTTPVNPNRLTGLNKLLQPSERAALYAVLDAVRQERDDLRLQLEGAQRLLSASSSGLTTSRVMTRSQGITLGCHGVPSLLPSPSYHHSPYDPARQSPWLWPWETSFTILW